MSRAIEGVSLLSVLFTSACCPGKESFAPLDTRKQFSVFPFYGFFGFIALGAGGPKFSHQCRFTVAVIIIVTSVSLKGRVYPVDKPLVNTRFWHSLIISKVIIDHQLRQPQTFSSKYAQQVVLNRTLSIPEASNPFFQ